MKTRSRQWPRVLLCVSVAMTACTRSRVVPSADRGDGASAGIDSGAVGKQTATTPRPVSPLSGSVVSSPHVRFQWAPRTSARVELSSTPTPPAQTLGSGIGELEVQAVPAGRWFWRVVDGTGRAGPFARLRVIPAATRLVRQGTRGGTDLNQDGFDDVVLGQDVFLGRTKIDGGDHTKDASIPLLPDAGSRCEKRPADVPPVGPRCRNMGELFVPGDIDGDGFDDVLAFADARCVLVFRGAASIPSPWLASERACPEGVEAPGPVRMVRMGDVNGDGFADVGLGVTGGGLGVFLGSAAGLSPRPQVLLPPTYQWTEGGDMNGDGFDDVAALSTEGDLAIFWGAVGGLGIPPVARVKVPFAGRTGSKGFVAAPLMRIVDWDGDGLADVVGVTSSDPPELWVALGGPMTSTAPARFTRRWPFRSEHSESLFAWDTFSGVGRSSATTFLGGWGSLGRWDFATVSYKDAGGFAVPKAPERLEGSTVDKPEAIARVGDVNGDGLEDVLVVTLDDSDGSRVGELTLGTAAGIDLGGAAYIFRYDGEREGGGHVGYMTSRRVSKARAP
jgi:hypothetical protein